MTVVDIIKDLILNTIHDVMNSLPAIVNIYWVTDGADNLVTDGTDKFIFREEE